MKIGTAIGRGAQTVHECAAPNLRTLWVEHRAGLTAPWLGRPPPDQGVDNSHASNNVAAKSTTAPSGRRIRLV